MQRRSSTATALGLTKSVDKTIANWR